MATSASQSQYGATTDVVATSSPQPLPASQPSATPAAAQGERSTAESNDNPQVEEVQAKAAATGTQQARYWRLEGAHTRVKDVGRSVALPNNIYIKTNFYIAQSRKYFPGRQLTRFLYFRGMVWLYIALGILSLLSPTSSTYAFIHLFLHMFYGVFWSQHLFVIFTTLPVVLSQPILVGAEPGTTNKHLELSVEAQRADILETEGEMVGLMAGVRGRGQVQAFTAKALEMIKACRIISIVCFIACPCFLIYCSAAAVLCALNGVP